MKKIKWGKNFYDNTIPEGTGEVAIVYEIGEIYNSERMVMVNKDGGGRILLPETLIEPLE